MHPPGRPALEGSAINPERQRVAAWSDLLRPPHPEAGSQKWKARCGGLLAVLVMTAYLVWRATSTIPLGGLPRIAGWLLWVVEAVPLLPLAARLTTLWRLDAPAPSRAGADQTFAPAIIFIPTYNEPAAVLAPTVAAACRLQPAHETWVLDDGDRAWVREMCETYGARYVQREEHEDAKAGNINHALGLLAAEGNPAELIGVLDCDHVPLEGFLHQTLGWFDDPRVALVQVPQAYFNDSAFDSDGFAGEQGIFFHVLMVSRTGPRVDPPWCGSTSVIRRSALEEVGGVATETITEDLHTTLKLIKRQWRSVYHHQVLAVGLAPDTPEQYLIQRRRWALGAMQVIVDEKLWKPKRWLSARNQMEYLVSALWWFEGVVTALGMLLPAAVLVSGIQPVRTDPLLYAGFVSAQILVRMVGAHLLYRGYTRWRHALELRVLRIPIGLQSLWWLITRRELAFQVTPKGAEQDRHSSPVPRMLPALAAIVAAVLGYGALTLFMPLPWHSSGAATLIGGVWLLWGEAVLLMGIARIRDPEFRTTRRVAHRFNVPAEVTVAHRPARLVDVSTTGVALDFGAGTAPGGDVDVELPGGSPILMHTVRAGGHHGAYQVGPANFEGMRRLADWIFFTPADRRHDVPPGLPAAAVMGDDLVKPGPVSPPPGRRNDIQGLRALAVGLVILSHLGLSAFGGGFVGVDVFFVISGFLITGLMLREFSLRRTISLRDFYTRRAQRILPAAILASAAILVGTGFIETSVRVREYRADALWSAAFLQNVHLIHQATDYFADVSTSPFQHYWSLSVEEQFYVVWPVLLLVLLRALKPGAVLVVVGAIVALSLGASIELTRTAPQQAYFSTYTRGFELGLGAFLALAVTLGAGVPTWFAWVGGVVGAATIAACGLRMPAAGFPGWHALVPTLATVALIAAGLRRQVGVNWFLGLAPFRWLGDISYSLYLWHFPVIVLGGLLVPATWSTTERNVVLVGVSLAAADLTYRLVETPLLRGRRTAFRGLRPLVWWPVAGVTALSVAFASTAYADYHQSRAQADAVAWYADHADVCAPGAMKPAATASVARVDAELACGHTLATLGAPVPPSVTPQQMSDDGFAGGSFCWDHAHTNSIIACQAAQQSDRRSIVLLGDSHMGQWLPAFQQIADRRGDNFVPFVKPGCPIWALDTYAGGKNGNDPACATYRASTLASIAAMHPALVVVASIVDPRAARAGNAVGDGWRAAIDRTLPKLRSLGSRVVVLGDTPLRTDAVPNCLGVPGNGVAACELERPSASLEVDRWLGQQADSARLTWLDPTPLVCAGTACPAIAAGIGMYNDASHITRTWSTHVSRALEQLLVGVNAFSG